MKKIFYLITLSLILFSCKKWLDVNDNPNVPNSTIPTADQRLPPLIAQFGDSYQSAGTRAAFLSQQLAVTYAVNNNWNLTRWYSNTSSANWPWQCWYVNAAVNVTPLIEAAQKVGAYHYIGAAKIIKAWGFGALSDFYGMMPYDEFDNASIITPKFDDGSEVQQKILALLDEAISDLSKTQDPGAPALSEGDILNHGNVDNWIRLAYSLKARFLNHLSKKSTYDPNAILDALSKGIQTDEQSSIMQYVNEMNPDGTLNTASDKEALQYTNTGTTARITQFYLNYLTGNYTGAPTGDNDMEDPRIDLLVPSSQNWNGEFVRTKGVDMTSDLPKSGPKNASYNATTNKFNSADSVYIKLRRDPYLPTPGKRIVSTGTWYTNRDSKGLLMTNAEMRFIEAEVKFRQNKLDEALVAYKAGIRSHMSIMGIDAAVIDNYLNSTSVVQDASKLTLSLIMIQKYIALSYSPELWVDLRRMDFCTDASGNYNEEVGIYKGFQRPSHVFIEAYPNATDWPRRFAVASYEINYNIDQVLKANADAAKPTYLNQPVWWDKP